MPENPIQGLMNTTMSSIKDMVDVNTIIGKPIETKNGVIIPLSKVTFGFASGGSEFNSETIDNYNKKEKEDHADRGRRSRRNIDPGDSEQSISGSENLLCDR